jgi:hypothetical protein
MSNALAHRHGRCVHVANGHRTRPPALLTCPEFMQVEGYLRGYRAEQPLDLALVERWRPVCAAARLADDIGEERAALLAAL